MTTPHVPEAGSNEWPCRQFPGGHPDGGNHPLPDRLVTFCYLLLRDGASCPGEIEDLALRAGSHPDGPPAFTNPHLEQYARSLSNYLTRLDPPPSEKPDQTDEAIKARERTRQRLEGT